MSRAGAITKLALSQLPEPGLNKTVHLALSGGVDSSVAGLLLRERGYIVKPWLLRCWDLANEGTGGSTCYEQELRSAEQARKALRLDADLRVVDLVSTYWTEVFQNVLLRGLERGETPNADLACNKHVKFSAFPKYLSRAIENERDRDSVDSAIATDQPATPTIATGHYARLRQDGGGHTQLLAGVDPVKDQSYFLASVGSDALRQFIMPVGGLTKVDVRHIAEHAGLPAANRRSSRGMCFIGKQSFAQFVSDFLPRAKKGQFLWADDDSVLAPCPWPAWAYTVGQRARIAGRSRRLFVVGTRGNDVVVSDEQDNRLLTDAFHCPTVDWVSGSPPAALNTAGTADGMHIQYKPHSNACRRDGVLCRANSGGFVVLPKQPEQRVATGQAVVLYDGDICLGASWPLDSSEWDQLKAQRIGNGKARNSRFQRAAKVVRA